MSRFRRGRSSRLHLVLDALVYNVGALIEIFVRIGFFGSHPALTRRACAGHRLRLLGRFLWPSRLRFGTGTIRFWCRYLRLGRVGCRWTPAVGLAGGEREGSHGKQCDSREGNRPADIENRNVHQMRSGWEFARSGGLSASNSIGSATPVEHAFTIACMRGARAAMRTLTRKTISGTTVSGG